VVGAEAAQLHLERMRLKIAAERLCLNGWEALCKALQQVRRTGSRQRVCAENLDRRRAIGRLHARRARAGNDDGGTIVHAGRLWRTVLSECWCSIDQRT